MRVCLWGALRICAVWAAVCAAVFSTAQAQDKPWALDVSYTAEVWSAVEGGLSDDARYLDNVDLTLSADLEKLSGWRGATLFLYGLYNNGETITQAAGDAQFISNIETGIQAARLYEAWIDQQIGDALSLRFGLYDVNSEFDVLESATLFIQAAHGIGTVIGLSGENGPSIFPVTSLGGRFSYNFGEGWAVRLAVLDGVPGDLNRPKRTTVQLGDGDGAFLIGELEVPIGQGKILLGHWRYTGDFDSIDGTRGGGNAGYFVRAERQFYSDPTGSGRGLAGFVRLGIGDGNTNPYNRFLGAGLVYSGPISSRPDDQIGLAIAAAFSSSTFQQQADAQNAEVNLELTYSAQITDWLRIQPDVQYIINPSANRDISNTLAIGLRAQVGWSF